MLKLQLGEQSFNKGIVFLAKTKLLEKNAKKTPQ
jgi:hypothetical protein